MVLLDPSQEPTLLVIGQATRVIKDKNDIAMVEKQETLVTLDVEYVEAASRLDGLNDVLAFPRTQLADNQKIGTIALR